MSIYALKAFAKLSFFVVFGLTATAGLAQVQAGSRCSYLNEDNLFTDPNLPLNGIDSILVSKSQKKMLVFRGSQVLKIYDIALGWNSVGHKTEAGDFKTPTGLYKISSKNSNSDFKLSLKISYPNRADIESAKKAGVEPGGDIMIHGLPKNPKWYNLVYLVHPKVNWTRGCVAVNNEEIELLYPAVRLNTPIEICE